MITTQHSRFETNNVKYNKGFSILEVLIAAFILSFISLTIFKTLDISILSSNLSNSLVSDADLKIAIHNVLKPEQCKRNLHPDNLNDISSISKTIKNSLKKYNDPTNPSDTSGVELIKINERFRDYLDIVKIELAGPDTDTQRAFTVYYKRNRVKHLGTKNNGVCDATDDSGCYKNTCNLEYEVTGADVTTCTVLDCFSIGSSTVNNVLNGCYSVENDSLIFGCGDAQNVGGKRTILFGHAGTNLQITDSSEFNAFFGSSIGWQETEIDSSANTFIGHSPAQQAKIYAGYNTFIGYAPGRGVTINKTHGTDKGRYNTFIGNQAGFFSTVNNSSNTFLGSASGNNATVEGFGNNFIGSYAGKTTTVNGNKNTFIGPGAGQDTTVTSHHNINIGNTILTKSSNHSLVGANNQTAMDSTAYDVPENEVWINGKIQMCDFTNGDKTSCTPVVSDSDLQAEKTKIRNLEDKISKICNNNPTLCQ